MQVVFASGEVNFWWHFSSAAADTDRAVISQDGGILREVAYCGKVEMARASGTTSPSHGLTQALQLGLSGRQMAALHKHQLNATFSEARESSCSPVYLRDTQREALLSPLLFVGFSSSILLFSVQIPKYGVNLI